MQVNPEEISRILKEEIKAYSNQMEFTEAGSVIQVGDGIAQVHGLKNAMSGELLEFADGTTGMALNLDSDSIGVVILGSDAGIKEGDPVKLTGRMAEVPVVMVCWVAWLTHLVNRLMGKVPLPQMVIVRLKVRRQVLLCVVR